MWPQPKKNHFTVSQKGHKATSRITAHLPVDTARLGIVHSRRPHSRASELRLDLRRIEVVLTQLSPDPALLGDLCQHAVGLGRAGQVAVVVQAQHDLAETLRGEMLQGEW